MVFEHTIELISLIISITAIIVTLQIAPKVQSNIIMGWRWITLALALFAVKQLLNMAEIFEYGLILELLFIVFLTMGLSMHLMKIMEYYHTYPTKKRKI